MGDTAKSSSVSIFQRLLNCSNLPTAERSKIFHILYDIEIVWIFSFIGGYVDAAGYYKLYGLFTSSVTGSVIAACASIFDTHGVVSRVFVALFFALGGGLCAGSVLKCKLAYGWKERSIAALVMIQELFAIAATIFLGLWFEDDLNSLSDWQLILVGSTMAFSMGVHSAGVKVCLPNAPATTVMTLTILGIAMQFSNAISYFFAQFFIYDLYNSKTQDIRANDESKQAYLAKMQKGYSEACVNVMKSFKPLFFFTTGALLGTALMKYITFWCLALPVGLLVLMIWDVYLGRMHEDSEGILLQQT
jgi:uncharacterized membrane protein YoaK (UPF0700 family)